MDKKSLIEVVAKTIFQGFYPGVNVPFPDGLTTTDAQQFREVASSVIDTIHGNGVHFVVDEEVSVDAEPYGEEDE
jgi:hypothetical protein